MSRSSVKEMIPQAAKRKLAQFVDVFTDRGAFTAEDTEKIFDAAKKHGLGVRAHVCQLSETALRPLLRFNVASFDHMDHVSDDDIPQLAKTRYRGNAGAGRELFSGLGEISAGPQTDRCGGRRWRWPRTTIQVHRPPPACRLCCRWRARI